VSQPSPSPRKVARSLQQLLESRKPNALVDRFIRWALNSYVTKENLENAIKDNVDILALSLNHFSLGHPLVAPLFKLALQMFFTEFVETYIADAARIYTILAQNPGVKEILDSDAGRTYLNNCCKYTYEALYDFCWSDYGST